MGDTEREAGRLLVVSNRLPVVVMPAPLGAWTAEAAAGGLVNAVRPVLRQRGGLWIGWPGTVVEDRVPDLSAVLAAASTAAGYELVGVELTRAERDAFYLGFSNEVIWPLFHDLQSRCRFEPDYWAAYVQVNRRFAHAIAERAAPGDDIWVHDYHLMHVAHELRAHGLTGALRFFLHIPFPPVDIFLKLPWRAAVLEGLLAYDAIGLQTRRDRDNLLACIRMLLPTLPVHEDAERVTVALDGRTVTIRDVPISIDAHDLAQHTATAAVEEVAIAIRRGLGDRALLLGVDRLDYTKGIPEKLRAFREALRRFPELRRRVTLAQIAVPSRVDIQHYRALRREIEQLVGAINGEFTEPGWVPIHLLTRRLSFVELLAYYLIADVALITPIKDGMNLVAKEYVTCNGGDGVLILSEFAGAAAQLGDGALLCNPYDRAGLAETLHRALHLPAPERRAAMTRLRDEVAAHDVFWWVAEVLSSGG